MTSGDDPLLSDPPRSSGTTGAIPRPGDDRPRWLVPVLVVLLGGFVAGLAVVAADRDGGGAADGDPTTSGADGGAPATVEASSPTAPDESVAVEGGGDGDGSDASGPDPVAPTTIDTVPDLTTSTAGAVPVGPGTVTIAGEEFEIVSACEEHRPFAPADEDTLVYAYAFVDAESAVQVVERRIDGSGDVAAWDARGVSAPAVATDVDGSTAFTAEFDEVGAVTVEPGGVTGLGCDSLVVTNEPGQLAFPTTRVVMAGCRDDEVLRGITTGGGSFTVEPSGDGSDPDVARVALDLPEIDATLVADTADAFVDDDQLSFAGFVESGDLGLDATVDIRSTGLAACSTLGL